MPISQLTYFKFIIIISLFISVLSNAKKISFIEKLKIKNPEQYLNFLNKITFISQVDFTFENNSFKQNQLMKIRINKEIDVFQKNSHVLYEVERDFVLNLEWITRKKSDLFNKVFSKIHSEKNILSLLLVHLLHTDSDFSLYLRNLPNENPLIYDYYYLQILNETPIYEKIERKIKEIKNDYIDIRGLLFSYGEAFKNKHFGSFLFGDFIWAYSIVDNFSIVKDDNLYLVPGIENTNIFGVEVPNTNIKENYNLACVYNIKLKYVHNNNNPTYQVILDIIPEDLLELIEKFPNAKECEIPYNINNDDLFLIYGKTLQEKEFDHALFSYDIFLEKSNKDDLKNSYVFKIRNDTNDKIYLSCNEHQLKTFEYQIRLLAQEYSKEENEDKIYLDLYKNTLINIFNLSKKLSKIKQFIDSKEKENHNIESTKEINNILDYLLNRQNFYEETFKCLEKSFKKEIKKISKKEINKNQYETNQEKREQKEEL